MRYADLKQERDDAIARAVEAERLSLKSEVDKLVVEHAQERAELLKRIEEDAHQSYLRGYSDGKKATLEYLKDIIENAAD